MELQKPEVTRSGRGSVENENLYNRHALNLKHIVYKQSHLLLRDERMQVQLPIRNNVNLYEMNLPIMYWQLYFLYNLLYNYKTLENTNTFHLKCNHV